MPTATQTNPLRGTIRMTLTRTEFCRELGGRLMAGTVVLVNEETADRWRLDGIAVDSAETDKTLKEQKLAELARLQAEIEAIGTPAAADDRSPAATRHRTVQRD